MSDAEPKRERAWWRRGDPLLFTARDEWGEVQLTRSLLGRELRFDGGALQGRLDLNEPWVPLSEYAVSMALAPALLPEARSPTARERVCLLGVGSGNLAWAYQRALPRASLTLVELREAVISLGRKGLKLGELPRSKVLVSPAEVALKSFEEASQDLIAVDLYLSHGMAPPLMTRAFWGDLFRSLSPEGVACVNVWSSDPEAYERLISLINASRGAARLTLALSHLSFSNVILFICAPPPPLEVLRRRAAHLEERYQSATRLTRALRKARASAGLSGEPLTERVERLSLL